MNDIEAVGQTIEQKRDRARRLLAQRSVRRYPLSPAQERLWLLQQLDDTGVLLNMPMGLIIEGELDVEALRRSLAAVVARQDALRTTFDATGNEPVQVVSATGSVELEVVDESKVGDASLQRHVAAIAGWRFDLQHGPLFKARLVELGRGRHALLWNMHHIVSDGWSMGLLARELGAYYAAARRGMSAALPELALRYGDYAAWQRSAEWERDLAPQLDYWLQTLRDAPSTLGLPFDRRRRVLPSFAGAREAAYVTTEVSDAVADVARRHGASSFILLLAAFRLFLSRVCGDEQIVIGTPVANRALPELEHLVGFFVNSLAIVGGVDARLSFGELLQIERARVLAALAHQQVPLEAVTTRLGRSGAPFRVMLAMQNNAGGDPFPGLLVREIEMPYGGAQVDLTLSVAETPRGLLLVWEYSTQLFDRSTILGLSSAFRTLLAGCVAWPERRTIELPLLPGAAVLRTLEEARSVGVEGGPSTLHEWCLRRLGAHRDYDAIIEDGGSLSFGEVHERARTIARRLLAAGARAGDHVILHVGRGSAWVCGLLGVSLAGCAAVPLDPELPLARRARLVAAVAARFVLSNEPTAFEGVTRLSLADDSAPGVETELPAVYAQSLAYVVYTSGSTGEPKPVAVSHAALTARMRWEQDAFPLSTDDRVLQCSQVMFDAAIWETARALSAGASLVVSPPGEQVDPSSLARRVLRERVTVLGAVPSVLRPLIDELESERTCLRYIVAAGERLPWHLAQRLQATGARVFNFYGQTEVGIDASCFELPETPDGDWVAIGPAIAGMELLVLDAGANPVCEGAVGEAYIAGPNLAWGYLGRAAATAERFLPHPYPRQPGERVYRTGDLLRRRAGHHEFVGRSDDQAKVRGVRVEPGEVDALLLQHPAVGASATFVVDEQANAEDAVILELLNEVETMFHEDVEVVSTFAESLAGGAP